MVLCNLEVRHHAETVRTFLLAWEAQESERCLELLHPDVVYTDNIIDVLTPVGGRTVGRAAFAKIMQTIAQKWEHLAFRIGPVTASTNRSNEVHCQIEFLIRHKPTGEELYGKNRFVACIKDGYIKSIDIFHDAPMFAAFLKLIGSAR